MPKEIKLTSTKMVNTPGIFRMFKDQYDSDFDGEWDRAKIVTLFAGIYKLEYAVSYGVLSGKIPVTIDDEAETVTFTVA